MPTSMRCLSISLNNLPEEYKVVLGYLTYHSGKLYNQALYLLKNKQAKVNVFDLYNKLKDSLHSKNLQSRNAQIVLDELVRAYKNAFNGHSKFPKFRPKNKPHKTLTYDSTGFKVVGTKIRLSISKKLRNWLKEKHSIEIKYLWIETGLELDQRLIKNVQIVPRAKEFELHIIYEVSQREAKAIKSDKVMVLDPNSSNFFAVVIEGVSEPYLIDGKGLKSLLRKYLKKIATLQSRLANAKKKGFETHLLEERLSKAWLKVKKLLKHYVHTVSNLILELAIKHGVKKIYVGDAVKNKNKESKLNSIANQIWSLLPHGKVKEFLEYKAKECGIEVAYISECFTSGVDSSTDGTVCKEAYTPEARIKRGLYKTKLLGYLNADINACRNFLKKLRKFDLISGVGKPIRLRGFYKLKSSSAILPYGRIGRSRGSVNLPVVIRDTTKCPNSPEASYL
nr:transposase [Dictyoglomus turgidum]